LELVPCGDFPSLLHFFVDREPGPERLCLPSLGPLHQRLCSPKGLTRRDEFPTFWQIVRPLGFEAPPCAVPWTHPISTLLVAKTHGHCVVPDVLFPSRCQRPPPALRPASFNRPIPLGAPLSFQGPARQGCPPSSRGKIDNTFVPCP
jgi:hypothetical protein